jgi:glyoxylase-like metal-dependent hydrolase (beta-lactamase superfamily II)
MITVHRVLAPNPGPMTLDGTNSWVIRSAVGRPCLLVDPGPDDARHRAALLALGPIGLVLLTHRHPDHAEGAGRLADEARAPLRAAPAPTGPRRPPASGVPLTDGELIEVDGVRLEVVATPGHSSDSVCLSLPERRALFTGDTVLGRGTAVIAHPDGNLADYLRSLRRLRDLASDGLDTLLPGHGDPVAPATDRLDAYLRHREQRLEQVRAALRAGARTPADVVEIVYADVDRRLWPAAEASVRAQLDYLAAAPSPS